MLESRNQHVITLQRPEIRQTTDIFLSDYTVKSRLVDVGIISGEDAIRRGAVGPMMRASGINVDMRKTGYGAYNDLDFEVIVILMLVVRYVSVRFSSLSILSVSALQRFQIQR